jgi:hypothetical protein
VGDLVHEHAGQPDMRWHFVGQHPEPQRFEDELAQQRRHVDDATGRGHTVDEPRAQVQGAHPHDPRHPDGVLTAGGNPHRTVRRYDPAADRGVHRHHTFGGVDQLMPVVRVALDAMVWRQPQAERTHGNGALRHGDAWGLAVLRHNLAI